MTLLYTVPTANGQRASIALEECGIDYEVRMVDLGAGEHRSEEMLGRNPFGRMPLLEKDDGSYVYGSMAIGLHAAGKSGRLLPAEAERDAFHHWLGVIMTDLAPAFAWQFYLAVLAPEKFEWGLAFNGDVIRRYHRPPAVQLANADFSSSLMTGEPSCGVSERGFRNSGRAHDSPGLPHRGTDPGSHGACRLRQLDHAGGFRQLRPQYQRVFARGTDTRETGW